MLSAPVDIYNLALSHVGSSVECQSTIENTAEANACRRFYDQVVTEVLEAYPWPFAKVTVTAALVENCPTPEWAFAYRYPQDCVTLHRILGPAGQFESRDTRVPYLIGRDSNGILVYTNWPCAVFEYTQVVTDSTQFAPAFVQAVAFKLAWYIAPRVTAGDPFKLGDRALRNYQAAIVEAQANAGNEEQPEPLPESEFIRCR